MNCPYCDREMQHGQIHFGNISTLRWQPEGEQTSAFNRFWNELGGIGGLTAVKPNGWGGGTISGDFCPTCQKMILQTGILK